MILWSKECFDNGLVHRLACNKPATHLVTALYRTNCNNMCSGPGKWEIMKVRRKKSPLFLSLALIPENIYNRESFFFISSHPPFLTSGSRYSYLETACQILRMLCDLELPTPFPPSMKTPILLMLLMLGTFWEKNNLKGQISTYLK